MTERAFPRGVYARGAWLWIRYSDRNGLDKCEPTKIKVEADPEGKKAAKMVERRKREVSNDREGIKRFIGPAQDKLTLGDLLATLIEHNKVTGKAVGEAWRIEKVKAVLGHIKARAVDPPTLRDYISKRQGEGAKSATINREIEQVGRAFSLARADGTINFGPEMRGLSLEEDNVRRRRPSDDEATAVLEEVKRRSPAAFDFYQWISLTAMRPKGVGLLEWKDLDAAEWVLTIRGGTDKNKFTRKLPVSGSLRAVIERRIAARLPGARFIFTRQSGKPLDTRTARQKIRVRIWNGACRAVGIEPGNSETGLMPYDLKRFAIHARHEAGEAEQDTMMFSGHKTVSMLRRYNDRNVEDLRASQAKVDAEMAKKPRTNRPLTPALPYKTPYKTGRGGRK